MRASLVAFLLLFVCSCGGGGDTLPPAPADGPGVTDSNLERTREILESCTLADLDRFLDILDLIQGATAPDSEGPDFQITNINLIAAAVAWSVDVDRDGTVDMTGAIRFEDALGNPTLPFDLTDLLGGLGDLASLLEAIEDGTVVFVSFTSEPDALVSGEIQVTMLGGVPTALSGGVTITGTDCTVELDLQNSGDLLGGEYPEASAYGTVVSSTGDVEGTVTFDGTSVVTLDMSIDGDAEVYSFTYDLATGELTDGS